MSRAPRAAEPARVRCSVAVGRAAAVTLAVAVLVTPLLLGGVPRRAAALTGALAFGVALAALAERGLAVRAGFARPWAWPVPRAHRWLLGAVAAALAVAALGAVPVPRDVLGAVSPSTVRLLDQVSGPAAPGSQGALAAAASWRPLSLAPADSLAALLWLIAMLAVAATVAAPGSLGDHALGARAPRPAVRALALVASSAAVVSMIALVQQATWNGRIGWIVVPADWGGQVPDGARASGTFVNPDHFAAFAWLGVVAGAALVTQARLASHALTRRMRDALAVGGVAAALTCAAGVVASGCRAATAAALGAGVVWAWGARRCSARTRPPASRARADARVRARRALVVAVALVSLVAVAWTSSRNVRGLADRWLSAVRTDPGGDAWTARTAVWRGTVAMVEAFPAGVGLGAWPSLHTLFTAPPAQAWSWRHAHSEPLELIAEVGLPGGLAFAVAIGAAVHAVLRRRRDEPPHELGDATRQVLVVGLAGTALHACLDFPLRVPAVALAVAVLVGAGLRRRGDPLAGPMTLAPGQGDERRGARRAWAVAAVTGALVACVGLMDSLAGLSPRLAALRPGPDRVADELERARASLTASGGPAALPAEHAAAVADAFRRAVAASPGRAETHHGVAISTPDTAEAARALAAAAMLAPWNALYQDQLAMLALGRGDEQRARTHVTRALRADPDLEHHPYLARGAAAGIGPALAEAVEDGLTRAFAEDRDRRPAGWNLARFHEQRGAPGAQARTLAALAEADPSERRWLVGAVRAYRRAGDGARADAAEALLLGRAGRDRVAAELALALDVYVPLGDLEHATRMVDAAERRDGPGGPLELARGRIAQARRDGAGAVAAFERAVERMPASTEAALLFAAALRGERRSSESLAAYRRALDLGADTPAVWAAIGDLHEQRREFRQAAEAYRMVLRERPDDRRILDARARAERRARGELAAAAS